MYQEIFVFLFGLAAGSFLNVVSIRLYTGESFFRGRSHCDHCKHQLGVVDLIPLVSFLCQKGACRYCKQSISWQYPGVEITAASAALLLYAVFGFSREFFIYCVYASFLIVFFIHDIKHGVIIDTVSFPAMGVSVVGGFFLHLSLTNMLLGGMLGASFFALQFILSKGTWIGGGDIRLGAVVGLMLGFPLVILALAMTYIGGAIVSLALVVSGKKTMKDTIPLGVFLTSATFMVILYGHEILRWYTRTW